MTEENAIKLTQYSHGAGCGCKIAPQVLEAILKTDAPTKDASALLVGHHSMDDAAVYQLDKKEALIATTDFFTPIVDDPYVFGKVAAANALSDVYAMGGSPLLALAILGWPVEKLPVETAQQVLEGAREICNQAHIPLAGGHSIDSREPIFGLSVNGRVLLKNIKQNATAQEGDLLLLTKPLGVGILSTAAKRGKLQDQDLITLTEQLTSLNCIGERLGKTEAVTAMTDVTGFGLGGHLIEMAEGAGLSIEIDYHKIPKIRGLNHYLSQNILPDATFRNWNAISPKIAFKSSADSLEGFKVLPDPQTNGGLLIAVHPKDLSEVQRILEDNGYADFTQPIGRFIPQKDKRIEVY